MTDQTEDEIISQHILDLENEIIFWQERLQSKLGLPTNTEYREWLNKRANN
jgi:hypothetical protein